MADLDANLAPFERECRTFADEWLGSTVVVESERRYNFIKIRIHVMPSVFIELYHNAQNGRGSYALIRDNQRIFGYDGVIRWHCHPLHHTEKHERCTKPRLSHALREMKHIVESLPTGEGNV
jgi:hypothetical protein